MWVVVRALKQEDNKSEEVYFRVCTNLMEVFEALIGAMASDHTLITISGTWSSDRDKSFKGRKS